MSCTLSTIEKRRLTFDVAVHAPSGVISEGTHQRAGEAGFGQAVINLGLAHGILAFESVAEDVDDELVARLSRRLSQLGEACVNRLG